MKHDGAGEVVVVTGASAGLGRATARAFGERGASVGLVARGLDGLEAARREIEEAGGRAVVAQADVADPTQVEAAAEAVERALGPIDVWVNDAMVSVFSPVAEMTAAEFRRVTEVTYLGYVYGTLSALHRMRARGHGVIVQVGSALAYRSIPLQSAYCAAKHAILGFTESLWCELIHDESPVRVVMVQMPALNTPQFGWVKSRLPASRSRCRPSSSPRWGRRPSSGRRTTRGASSTSASPPSRRSPASASPRASSITTSPASATRARRRRSPRATTALTTSGSPCPATTARTAGSTRGRAD